MGKPTKHFSDDIIRELIRHLLIYATFPIRTRGDCAILSKKIQEKGAGYISESTLYRLILTPDKSHSFYTNTYDKLAAFIGMNNMNDFEQWQRKQRDFDFGLGIITVKNKPVKSMVKVCIHTNSFYPLQEFTEQLHELEQHQKMRLGLEIYQSLLSNPNNNLAFFKRFSHLPVVRDCFFENCIDPEFKLIGYAEGLQYYLNQANPKNSLPQFQQFVFGNCILFRHFILKNKKQEAKKYGKKLYEEYSIKLWKLNKLFIFPRMRYLAYKIWWLELNNLHLEAEKYTRQVLEYCEDNLKYWSENEQRIAFSCLAEVLLSIDNNLHLHIQLKSVFNKLLLGFSDTMIQKPLSEILSYTGHDGLLVYKRIYS